MRVLMSMATLKGNACPGSILLLQITFIVMPLAPKEMLTPQMQALIHLARLTAEIVQSVDASTH